MTPYEALYGVQPDVSHWRALGCKCWVLIPKEQHKKLDPHMSEGRFVGYAEGHYKVYDVLIKKIVRSRNVIFAEEMKSLSKPDVAYDLDQTD
jgi:hypothetical protein